MKYCTIDRPGFGARYVIVCIATLLTLSAEAQESNEFQEPGEAQVVRIATRETPPFAFRDEDGRWRGISIELVRQIRTELGSDPELEFLEMGLEEMIAAVSRGDVDMAAAALTVNYEREQRVDFSHPYYSAGLGIAVRFDKQSQGFWGLLRAILSPTFLRVVIALLVTMLAIGVLVYLTERRTNRDQFGGNAFRGILAGVWWSAVTLTTVGYGDKVPKSAAGRIIGLGWMFSGLFIIASFTAAVTSALTVTELRSHINGPADLSRARIATVQDSTSSRYLRKRKIVARHYAQVIDALDALAEGTCDAVVYDAPLLRYRVHQRFADTLFVLATEFERQDYAFALPPGSRLREPVNQALLRITDAPEWQERLTDLLGQ